MPDVFHVTVELNAMSSADPDPRSAKLWSDTPPTSYTFDIETVLLGNESVLTDQVQIRLAEYLFTQTNIYQGFLWNMVCRLQPAQRSHTALSIGDVVVINDRRWTCGKDGWREIHS
jgi:hypothetical protein